MFEKEDIHILPLNDLRDHELSLACWCKPEQDYEEPNLWIHNSMDQREDYEEGRRMKS